MEIGSLQIQLTPGKGHACSVATSCLTLWDPKDYSPPGSYGILQARTLEGVAIFFSRDLPNPGMEPRSPAWQADSLLSEPPGKPIWYPAAAAKSLQSCPTLCDPRDGSPQGSPVPGILQARTLEWVTISFARGSSWPRDWTWVSHFAGRLFTVWATTESHNMLWHTAKYFLNLMKYHLYSFLDL